LKDDVIKEISYMPYGCEATQAAGSMLMILAQGKTLTEAFNITPEAMEEKLGGLPQDHIHCAALAKRMFRQSNFELPGRLL
jgi:nitrogen fixation NifU-like protein